MEFFFFDTTPFQDKYFTEEDHKYDWRGVLPRDKYLSNALKVSFLIIDYEFSKDIYVSAP